MMEINNVLRPCTVHCSSEEEARGLLDPVCEREIGEIIHHPKEIRGALSRLNRSLCSCN